MNKPGDVSRLLDIPASTLRNYAKIYKDYLSKYANRRRRSYTDQDIKTLDKIKTLSAQGFRYEEIKVELDKVVPSDESTENATVTVLSDQFKLIDDTFGGVNARIDQEAAARKSYEDRQNLRNRQLDANLVSEQSARMYTDRKVEQLQRWVIGLAVALALFIIIGALLYFGG